MITRSIKLGNTSVTVENRHNTLIITLPQSQQVLGSGIYNGGWQTAEHIINHHVPADQHSSEYKHHRDPAGYLEEFIRDVLRLKGQVVGMMTAADMDNAAIAHESFEETEVLTIATAGVKVNAGRAGDPAYYAERNGKTYRLGTINIILLTNMFLPPSTMVRAVKMVTESKTAALQDLDIRSRYSEGQATGTGTDSIVIVSGTEGLIRGAGKHTKFGELIGKAVTWAVKEALFRQDGLTAGRPVVQRLEERGMVLEPLLDKVWQIMGEGEDLGKLEKLRVKVMQALSSPDLHTLIMAAIRADEDVAAGLSPSSDTAAVLVGLAVLDVLQAGNKREALTRLWKDDILKELPAFRRAVLMALALAVLA